MKMVDFIANELVPSVVEELMNKRTGTEIDIKEMPYFPEKYENKVLVNSLLEEKVKVLLEEAKVNLDKVKYENYTLKSILNLLEATSNSFEIKESCKEEINYSDEKLNAAMIEYNTITNVEKLVSKQTV